MDNNNFQKNSFSNNSHFNKDKIQKSTICIPTAINSNFHELISAYFQLRQQQAVERKKLENDSK